MIADPSEASARSRRPLSWWIFVAIAIILLPILIRLSFEFGVTWDEKARHKYGEMVWEYLRGLRPRSDFSTEDGGEMYGGLFDTICAAIERYIPANRYVIRHAVNATFGWAGIVYCGRLAARLFGQWAGVIALVLMTASPRYFGDSMNNPKDLPFAALTIVALYYISTVSPRWPYVSRSTAIKIVIALALALNVRAASLLYLGYFGLLVVGYTIAERHFTVRRLLDTGGRLAGASVAVLVLGTVFWPWAQGSPLIRPIQALLGFANFPYSAGMLFDGGIVVSDALPKSYVPWWMLISTPLVVLLGVAIGIARGRQRLMPVLLVGGVAALPIVLVIAMGSTLYDGIRHLLFVYPPLVALAAWGWASCLSADNRTWVRGTAAALLIVGVGDVVIYQVRSHPNQDVYFNEIVGGPKGAFGRYPMDYWGNCLLEAVAWSATAAQRSGVPIVVSGEPWQVIQLDAERFHQLAFTIPYRNQHEVDIRLAQGSREVMEGLANRPGALYTVRTADGAFLCGVYPGPRFADLQEHLAMPPAGLSTRQLLTP